MERERSVRRLPVLGINNEDTTIAIEGARCGTCQPHDSEEAASECEPSWSIDHNTRASRNVLCTLDGEDDLVQWVLLSRICWDDLNMLNLLQLNAGDFLPQVQDDPIHKGLESPHIFLRWRCCLAIGNAKLKGVVETIIKEGERFVDQQLDVVLPSGAILTAKALDTRRNTKVLDVSWKGVITHSEGVETELELAREQTTTLQRHEAKG
mmetsp:Transcript_38187/g.89591  ORF Transcript_38187/g.89591 Transcript_38187/m.89591 type:complete len:209 (-) Transcript_38187:4112-4738(-)